MRLYRCLTKENKELFWKIKPVLADTFSLKNAFAEMKFSVVNRRANKAADWVANQSKEGACF